MVKSSCGVCWYSVTPHAMCVYRHVLQGTGVTVLMFSHWVVGWKGSAFVKEHGCCVCLPSRVKLNNSIACKTHGFQSKKATMLQLGAHHIVFSEPSELSETFRIA